MGRRYCKARGCPVNSVTHPLDALMAFPSDPKRFEKWCKVAQYRHEGYYAYLYLCHRHFARSAFTSDERKKCVRGANPCFTTGPLNSLTGDYTPADVKISTASEHEQQSFPTSSSQFFISPSQRSESPVHQEEVHLPDGGQLHESGIGFMEVDSLPAVHDGGQEGFPIRDSPPVASGCGGSLLLSQDEMIELGVCPLSPFLEGTRSGVESMECDSENVNVGPLCTSTPLVGEKEPGNSSVPSTSTSAMSFLESTPSSSTASRVATQGGKKSCAILGQLGLTRLSQLTPLKVTLYHMLRKTRKTLGAIRKSSSRKSLKLQTNNFVSGNDVLLAKRFAASMSLPCANLMVSQIRCFKRKPHGRRWTLEEKLMSVALFKQSPRSYRFLRSMFALPTPRTLTTMINRVPMKAGINAHVFEHLKKRIDSSDDERYAICSLIWDEMSIKELLTYSSSEDVIYGYQDLGDGKRSRNPAQHALVFTAVGLFHKWKQPLAFYFTPGNLGGQALTDIIKSVLSQCNLSGLKVRASVCDGHSVNRKAYQLLGSSVEKPYFTWEGVRVFTLFDPPHLLKCTRNMLVKHDLQFPMEEVTEANGTNKTPDVGTASWRDIRKAADEDAKTHVRLLRKLTPAHLDPSGASAMKVSLAAQILSDTVAATIETYVRFNVLEPTATATARACSFFNKLFDSFNGYKASYEGAGGLRSRLSRARQAHFYEFWDTALANLRVMKFLSQPKRTEACPENPPRLKTATTPTLLGWIRTITAVKLLWESLLGEVPDTTFLELRRLSQDPLENLFGSVRSKCGANYNPSASQFASALKTCLLNNMVSSDRGNCEADRQPGELLNNLQQFLTGDLPVDAIREEINASHNDTFVAPRTVVVNRDALGHKGLSVAYVCGFAVKRYLGSTKYQRCSAGLLSACPDEYPSLTSIAMREFSTSKQSLAYPSKGVTIWFDSGLKLVHSLLEEDGYSPNVLRRLTDVLKRDLDFAWWENHCPEHGQSVLDAMILSLCRIYIPWWCKVRNREMKAAKKDARTRKMRILQHQ